MQCIFSMSLREVDGSNKPKDIQLGIVFKF